MTIGVCVLACYAAPDGDPSLSTRPDSGIADGGGGDACVNNACWCGTTAVTLTQIQTTTFTPSCSGCHSSDWLDLSTKDGSFASLVNKATATCGSRKRVVPGDVANSYLVNKLTGIGMCGGARMPRSPLGTAEIDNIRNWICNGAKDN